MKYLVRNLKTGEFQAVEGGGQLNFDLNVQDAVLKAAPRMKMGWEGKWAFKAEVYHADEPLDIPAVRPLALFLVIRDERGLTLDRLG